MKSSMAFLMIVVVGFAGMGKARIASAQLDTPDCVMCMGVPGAPACHGGLASGYQLCLVAGYSCSAQDPCFWVGGGGGCFVADTPVETPSGSVRIEDLRVGDTVFGMSQEGVPVINEVVATYRTLSVKYYLINGDISVTGTHPFLVEGDWVDAQNVRVGDELMGADGAPVLVRSVETIDRGVRVYNITVSGDHTFIAGGILVHNKSLPGQR